MGKKGNSKHITGEKIHMYCIFYLIERPHRISITCTETQNWLSDSILFTDKHRNAVNTAIKVKQNFGSTEMKEKLNKCLEN